MSYSRLLRKTIANIPPKAAPRAVWAGGVRLDRAETPFPPSKKVADALRDWAAIANRYPEPDCRSLKQAIAAYVGCGTAQLLIGNGSDEVIDTIVRCCLDPGDEIVVPAPTFYFYQRSAEVNGGRVVFAEMADGFELRADAILDRVSPKTKVVFLANPNNPTGRLASREQIEKVVSRSPSLVVVDECYFEFAGETVIDLLGRYDNLVILRSFSKAFGLAGVRLGYGIGNEALIERLYSAMQPFPVGGAAQAAGIAALSDLDYMRAGIVAVKREVKRLGDELGKLGFLTYPSETNFVLADVSRLGIAATPLVQHLRKSDIYIWDCTGARGAGDRHVRISTGTREDNDLLLTALKAALAALTP